MNKTILALLIAMLAGAAAAAPDTSPERQQQALNVVNERLKDPSSAQFRNLRFSITGALCGEVNAKNSYGGYNGFRKFMVKTENEAMFADNLENGMIDILCKIGK